MTDSDTLPRRGFLPRGRGVTAFGLANLVSALGTGVFYPYTLLFFPALLGLPLTQVGLVLTAAALVALPGMFWVGRLIDRVGPRSVLIAAALLRAVGFTGYVTIRHVVAFALFSVLIALCNRAEQAASPALAVALAAEGERNRWLALSRTVFNAGIGGGALLGSALIGGGSAGLVWLGMANAAGYLLAGLVLWPLRPPPVPAPDRARVTRRPWRDGPFLAVVAANSASWLIALAVETGLSAYLVGVLGKPAWLVGVLFAINTGLLIVLQLPLTSALERRGDIPILVAGTLVSAVFLVLVAMAGGFGTTTLVVALVLGMVVYTLGELATTHARYALLTDLPPPAQLGSYLAFSQVAAGITGALVPVLVAALLDSAPAGLWWLLAGLSALTAAGVLAARPLLLARTRGDL
ncbi:MFS family permease [Actinokineospora baliensis]|uniref:MFS transporter n=1 Tax=Actinokineospora baliensis TaxID=547056 RepID=UPI00195666AC|nr:MFS transporter [Actinokineospora baliensis]MBM7773963.1 MFS family permease [Actinokineospora baliensis]